MKIPTTAELRQALTISEQRDALESQLSMLFRSTAPRRISAASAVAMLPRKEQRKRGPMSAAGRKRISDAAKARWAKLRAKA